MEQDFKEKLARFIDSSVKVRETFSLTHPAEQDAAVEKYCTAFYDSNLWNLKSEGAEHVYTAWRTGIKLSWGVNSGCRTYLLQEVLAENMTSLRARLLLRFYNFFRSLIESPFKEVSVLARLVSRDARSNIGSNLNLLREETGLDPWIVGHNHLKEDLIRAEH